MTIQEEKKQAGGKWETINFIGVALLTGTGKSVTGAHLAYASIKSNAGLTYDPNEKIRCVMYCGPSNKSVDVVLGKYTRTCNVMWY